MIVALLFRFRLNKFFFKISTTFLSFSTKVIFFAPLEIHSRPKDPTPENKSKTLDFFKSIFNKFE